MEIAPLGPQGAPRGAVETTEPPAEDGGPANRPAALRAAWERWQAGLTVKPTLGDTLPPLRMLLVMDNLAGHLTACFVVWLFDHGIMPLYTPLSGSWLNMTESIQRILAGGTPVSSAPRSPALTASAAPVSRLSRAMPPT